MSKVNRTFISLLILTMSHVGAWAQSPPAPAATGKVVGLSGTPMAGQPLQVQGPQGKTVVYTDAKGQWSLYNLPAGTYSVTPLIKAAPSNQPVKFSIKDTGVVDKLFGNTDKTFYASDIKLNSD
jgi:Carboxypeptidase regulatory-like domain